MSTWAHLSRWDVISKFPYLDGIQVGRYDVKEWSRWSKARPVGVALGRWILGTRKNLCPPKVLNKVLLTSAVKLNKMSHWWPPAFIHHEEAQADKESGFSAYHIDTWCEEIRFYQVITALWRIPNRFKVRFCKYEGTVWGLDVGREMCFCDVSCRFVL